MTDYHKPPPIAIGKDTTLHVKIGFMLTCLAAGAVAMRWAWSVSAQLERVAEKVEAIQLQLVTMDDGHLARSAFEHWVTELERDNPDVKVPAIPRR